VGKLRLLLLPALLGAFAVAFTACGGGESEEGKIARTVESLATSTDPADCEALATSAFLKQTQVKESGAEALESCEEDAEKTAEDPDSVQVSNVEVDGPMATADAAFSGGTFDGQSLSVALVKEDGGWKLDQVTGFALFDRDRLVESFQRALEEGPGASAPRLAACIGDVLRESSRSQVEEVVIGGSLVPLEEIIEGCTG
jgi:hypothetical protein